MWARDDEVTCPACGRTIDRSAAREYDKHGDRWERGDKAFEYLCRPCHDALCHQDRAGLEALLVDLDAGRCSDREFLRRYARAVEGRDGPIGDQ